MAKKELDRLSKNLKKNLSIKLKMMFMLIGAVTFTCAVVLFVTLGIFNKNLVRHEQQRIETNSQGVMNIVADWKLELVQYGYLFSINQEVAEALYHQDASLSSIIEEITSNLDLDFYAVTDKEGNMLVSDNLSGDILANKSVKKALSGTADWCYDSIGDQVFSIVSVYPIFYSDELVGTVLLGYALDNNLLCEEVTNGYDLEATIFKDNLRIDTTLKDEQGNKLIGTTLDNSTITKTVLKDGKNYYGNVTIAGKAYSSAYLPVVSSDGSITGMIFVAKSLHAIDSTKMQTIYTVIPLSIGLIVLLVVIVWTFIRWLMWRIKNVSDSLEEMASGEADLTKRCKLMLNDEIGTLVIHFDAFCDKLQQIISGVKESKNELTDTGNNLSNAITETSESINGISSNIDTIHLQITNSGNSVSNTANAVKDVTENINLLNSMIQEQTLEITQAASAVEQMIGNISSVNTSVEKMANSFTELSSDAQTGFTKQQDVNERIKMIETQSAMLQEANQVILDIAEQTNLLAMNAAIEAAHAGDAGKGFSVVADEIRKLSETSSVQSQTIGDQLNIIRDSISGVVSASNESSEAFASVSNKLKETDELVIQIKAALDEQTEGSKQISDALRSMNDSTSEVNSAYKTMSQKNKIIQDEVEALQEITDEMQSSMEEMSDNSIRIKQTGSDLNNIATHVQLSIEKIGTQIDLFKV
ncbi:MAG: methyl-accepting chemotaxis protein [Treponema sp.]|nr:methyl-accepting chemotaxis protein [Treponema sp.]